MSEEDDKKLFDDVKWLMERCPKLNTLSVLEPTCQTLSIMNSLSMCNTPGDSFFKEEELAKLALVGIIAMHVRKLDENKFQELSPYAYIQVANAIVDDGESSEAENYRKLIHKLHHITLDPFKP